MSFRKTILIDHTAMGRKCTVSWNGIWFSVPWLGPTGCQKNSIFLVRSGKQGETEKEGGQATQSQPSACHARFTETRLVVLFFDVKRNPHKHSWRESLYLKIQSLVWNLWSLWFSLSCFPSSKCGDTEQKDNHSRSVLCTDSSAKLSCPQVHHFPAIGNCNFNL